MKSAREERPRRDVHRIAQAGASKEADEVGVDLDARREAIAERLRMARIMAGLSQGQVARMIGLHRPSVSEAEAGRRRVPAEELAEYARIYAVNAGWLTGADPQSLDPQDARVQLAARELGKLKPEDLDRVLHLLAALRGPAGEAL
jgi:transcriptional regulator with XRE-family HTH domain